MRVNVGSIKGRRGASLDLDFEERMESPWDGNVVFVEPVSVSVKVTNAGRGFYVTGDARVRARITCDRCLESYSAEFVAPFEQPFRQSGEPDGRRLKDLDSDSAAGEEREAPEEDESRTFDGEVIDLDETVREAFLLAAPVKFVCRDDCLGICPECGANRNETACGCERADVDPRLAGLAALLGDEGSPQNRRK